MVQKGLFCNGDGDLNSTVWANESIIKYITNKYVRETDSVV
jgi:hypothetical protein